MEEAAEKTEISADVTALTSASDLSWAITGVGFHLFNALLNQKVLLVFLLHNFIVGGYCGRPASGVLPAVHDGRVGHRADRRPSPCPLWARAVRQIHLCNPGGSVGHLTNKVIHFDHNHVH